MQRIGGLIIGGMLGLTAVAGAQHPASGVLPTMAGFDPVVAAPVLEFLTNPVVALLLLVMAMVGLMFEVKAGAFGLGGLLSVVSLGLFFGSSLLLGLAGWEEVILLGLGMIALMVEVFLLPGFGVAGVLGILFMAAATVLTLAGGSPGTGDIMGALGILGASLAVTAAVFYAWIRHLPGSERFAGLLHTHGVARGEGYISAPQRDDLIGQVGTAITDLRPSGTAEIGGERMDVVTEGEFIVAGASVTVINAEGYRHVVRLANAATLHLPHASTLNE
jgi:membrane-bound serine protease (ClpP class)